MEGMEGITFERSRLVVAARDLEEFPAALATKFAATTKELDLSFNKLERATNLEAFTKLCELVLDNNQMRDFTALPACPTLKTLSVNGNKIDDLDAFLDVVSVKFPNLSYLSMVKNPACPYFDEDSADYQRYRLRVLYKLKSLKYLDAKDVTRQERAEAERKGEMLKVAKPDPAQRQFAPEPQGEQLPALPSDLKQAGESSPATYNQCAYVYYGKQSEGNRFILNTDL
eukprot:TRINITY_DN826_c0_g1_i2.p1 TRINITY_DN826_c0_g1~~TRINITY_DN826_c0_g1_i2.p1  ORF type:complete len:263 (-),score=90.02 TRINITY_DN826_c0_g1_i2:98-781(-)